MKTSKILMLTVAGLVLGACSGGEKAAPKQAAESAPEAVQVTDVSLLTGDAEAGRVGFGQCRSCHAIEAGMNRVGPSMHGVVGRAVGTEPGYRYSTAMAVAGGVWDDQHLFDYLEKPREVIPGTKMTYVGIKDAQRRADIIAYLKTLS